MSKKIIKRELVYRNVNTGNDTVTYPITTIDAVFDETTGKALTAIIRDLTDNNTTPIPTQPTDTPDKSIPIFDSEGRLKQVDEYKGDKLLKSTKINYSTDGQIETVVESGSINKTHRVNYENGSIVSVSVDK
jgi:hypothetical protein